MMRLITLRPGYSRTRALRLVTKTDNIEDEYFEWNVKKNADKSCQSAGRDTVECRLYLRPLAILVVKSFTHH